MLTMVVEFNVVEPYGAAGGNVHLLGTFCSDNYSLHELKNVLVIGTPMRAWEDFGGYPRYNMEKRINDYGRVLDVMRFQNMTVARSKAVFMLVTAVNIVQK